MTASRLLSEGVDIQYLDDFRGCVFVRMLNDAPELGDQVVLDIPGVGVNHRHGRVVRTTRPLSGPEELIVELEPRPS